MTDILLPSTDAGVVVQLVVLGVATVVGLVLTRRHREVRLLVIGVAILLLGLMAVRAIH